MLRPPPGQKVLSFEGAPVQLPEIPQQVNSASEAFSAAFEIARVGDVLGWRKLLTRIKPRVFSSLVEWRENELAGQTPETEEFLAEVIDKAVEIISPLIVVALVGAESDQEKFRDSQSLIDDLLNIPQWNTARKEFWCVDIPDSLIYVYHSLHGGLSINLNQVDSALGLARVEIPLADKVSHVNLWRASWLMGFSNSLGSDCTKGWKYLTTAYKRWAWLRLVFSDELAYQTSLVAYYMALNIHELASEISTRNSNKLYTITDKHFSAPPTFVSEGQDINERAIALLLRNPQALTKLWTSVEVTREQMEDAWEHWIRLSKDWFWHVPNLSFDGRIYHRHLFDDLQP